MPTDTQKTQRTYKNETLRSEIAARLRLARRLAGYQTLTEFCRAHNIPKSTFSQYETAERALTIERALELCDLLGTNIVWLLTGEGNPRDTQETMLRKLNSPFSEPADMQEFQALLDAQPPEIASAFTFREPAAEQAPLDKSLFTQILNQVGQTLSRYEDNPAFDRISTMAVDIYHQIAFNAQNDKDADPEVMVNTAVGILDSLLFQINSQPQLTAEQA